jgi:enoyl-[acyl-carrier protein] reductase I
MSFHIPQTQSQVLAGKVGLVTGIANDQSIADGCARALRDAGASLAITYLNEKARPYVEPLAGAHGAELSLPLEVREAPQMTAVFAAIREKWGRLDFLVHSLAFAPKADLQGHLVDSSVEGFLTAMDISCHSFVRMAKLAEPLMTDGGVLVTMSYYGADKVIANYSLWDRSRQPSRTPSVTWPAAWPKGDPRPCRLAGSAQNMGGFRRCPLR